MFRFRIRDVLWLMVVVALAVVGSLRDASADDHAAAKAMAELQGEWEFVHEVHDWRRLVFRPHTLTLKDDQYIVTREDKTTTRATFKIDASQKPKAFDLVVASGRVRCGIYKVDDDKLTLAFMETSADMPDQRPVDFSMDKAWHTSIAVYRRVPR